MLDGISGEAGAAIGLAPAFAHVRSGYMPLSLTALAEPGVRDARSDLTGVIPASGLNSSSLGQG